MSYVIFSRGRRHLQSAPINRSWIMQGKPEAKGCPLFETSDKGANVHEWECTGGRFVWHYTCDEIVHVVEGDAHIKDLSTGVTTDVAAGSSILFQRGSSAEWTVDHYIRKIAINHMPLSQKLVLLRSAWHRLKRLFGKQEERRDGGLSGTRIGSSSPVA